MGTGKRKTQGWPVLISSVLAAENIRGQKRAGTDPVVAAPQTWETSRVPITMRYNSEVMGDGKRSLTESSANGATSTVVLGVGASFGERCRSPKGSSKLPRWPRSGETGAGYRTPVICPKGNNPPVTLVRQMARAARPLNAPAESGRGALETPNLDAGGRVNDTRRSCEVG